jgi:hypothetical protein
MDEDPPAYGEASLYQTVVDALVRKGADPRNLTCPACSHAGWITGNQTVHFTTLEGGRLIGTPDQPEGFEVAPIWCARCGFLRLHVLQALVADS